MDGIYVRLLLIIFFTENIMSSFRNDVFVTGLNRKKHYNAVNLQSMRKEENGKGNLISALFTDKDNLFHEF